jgi:hypothetical protein
MVLLIGSFILRNADAFASESPRGYSQLHTCFDDAGENHG